MKFLHKAIAGMLLCSAIAACADKTGSRGPGGFAATPADLSLNPDIDKAIDSSEVTDDMVNPVSDKSSLASPEMSGEAGVEGSSETAVSPRKIVLRERDNALRPRLSLDTHDGRWFRTPLAELTLPQGIDYEAGKKEMEAKRAILHELQAALKKGGEGADDIKARIAALREEMQSLRYRIGYGRTQMGIHTYWANQNLLLRVKNVQTPGIYRLGVIAKNMGPLPPGYRYFNISVRDRDRKKALGGLCIEASDTLYRRGAMEIELEPGSTRLNLVWTNEAWQKSGPRAVIQIKNIDLRFARKARVRTASGEIVRTARHYSRMQGIFYWTAAGAVSYWKDQSLVFNFPALRPGAYEISVWARNHDGPLPAGYRTFDVSIDSDGVEGSVRIPADGRVFRKGTTLLDLTGGDTDLSLTWRNDRYREGTYDTNIEIDRVTLRRRGESKRSAVAAYLIGTNTGNRVLVFGALVVLVVVNVGISLWIKRRKVSSR